MFSGAVLLMLGLGVNLFGINPLKYFVNAGIIASIGIGVLLLLFFRNHSFSLVFEGLASTQGTEGSYLCCLLTAMAVGGWAFLGFDACSQVSEETADARTSTPRATLRSMILVGLTVMLTAFAVTLSYTNTAGMVSGQIIDPVTPAVVDAFGAWSERPFVGVVLIAFIACVVSVQTYIGRAVFASFGLALGLNATAVGTLIAFGCGGFFVVFLIVITCALLARLNAVRDSTPAAIGRFLPLAKGSNRLGPDCHVMGNKPLPFLLISVK